MTRRVVCTVATGPHAQLLDVTGPALASYAERHGYELVIVDRRLAPSRPAAWDKIALIHELLDTTDLTLWIDADALVLAGAPDIEPLLECERFLHLVEHRIDGMRIPNTGVMAIRREPRTAEFFERVWESTDDVNHKWWENAAVLRLLGYQLDPVVRPGRATSWRRHTGFLDGAWNSIPEDPAREPHVMHFPGKPVPERLAALRRAAALV